MLSRATLERRLAAFVERGDAALTAAVTPASGSDPSAAPARRESAAPTASSRVAPPSPAPGTASSRRCRAEGEPLAADGAATGGDDEGAGALDVFKNRPFLFLWLAQAFTQIGGNMVIFGLTVIIAGSRTRRPPSAR